MIHVNEVDRIVITTFEDGAVLHAAPTDDDESKARAAALGYTQHGTTMGLALWRMTVDHERLHHLLAEARGHPHSIALWYAAHPEAESTAIERKHMDDEERIVLLIQRLLNEGIPIG